MMSTSTNGRQLEVNKISKTCSQDLLPDSGFSGVGKTTYCLLFRFKMYHLFNMALSGNLYPKTPEQARTQKHSCVKLQKLPSLTKL